MSAQPKQNHFYRAFKAWPLENRDHLNITAIQSKGGTLEDLLANAELTLEDWHGNEGPETEVTDLPKLDFDILCAVFEEFLGEA